MSFAFAFLDFWFAPAGSGPGDGPARLGAAGADDGGGRTVALPGDEAALVARVRAGDATALEVVFRRHAPELLRFAERQLRSAEAAEDVVQEVFLAVWRIREGWEVRTSLATYLFQAVRHRVASRSRQRVGEDPRGRAVELTPVIVGTSGATPADELELSELRDAVERAIAALSPKTREVFLLSRDHGLAYREIAALLGVSVKTVEMHVGRALAALRTALGTWRE